MTSSRLLETSRSHEFVRELEAQLRATLGSCLRIRRLRCRPFAASTSSAIEEVDVSLSDGTNLELIAKDLGPSGVLRRAGDIRPRFVRDPRREIEVYRHLLSTVDLGTARYFGAIVDPAADRFVLLLERVNATELHEVGSQPVWVDVARWLAGFHSAFDKPVATGRSWLISYDAAYFRRWPVRARQVMDHEQVGPERRRVLAYLADRHEHTVEALLSIPATLVHGDLYSSNVLVGDQVVGRRVCTVDWEMAGIGPALLDLATLTSGDWDEEQRRTMVLAYSEALEPTPSWPPPLAELIKLLDHCHLHLAMQWLGWSSNWDPPARHARDWLAVGLGAAERIGH